MTRLILLGILCCFTVTGWASPLFEEPRGAAKEHRPDPLDAIGSEDVPVVHTNDFDMILTQAHDEHAAESMHYQNFEFFHDAVEVGGGAEEETAKPETEYNMDESQFVTDNRVRAPQRPNWVERKTREVVLLLDADDEEAKQWYYTVGGTQPQPGVRGPWDQFDYDAYLK